MGPTFKQQGLFTVLLPLLALLCLFLSAKDTLWQNTSETNGAASSARVADVASALTANVQAAWNSLADFARKPTGPLPARYLQATNQVPQAAASLTQMTTGSDLQEPVATRMASDSADEMAALAQAAQTLKSTNGSRSAMNLESAPYRAPLDQLQNELTILQANEAVTNQVALEEAMQQSHRFRRFFFAACGISLLSLVLFTLYLRRVELRLYNLAHRGRRLSEGKDLDRTPTGRDEVSQLYCIFYDMAHKHASTLRREQTMIKNALDIVCSITPAGIFTKISPACLNVWGYRPSELIGRHISEVMPPTVLKPMKEMLKTAFSGQTVTDFENECCRKNGSLVTMNWSAFVSELGDVVFCVAHDITMRKQMEIQTWHKAYHDSLTELPNRLLFHDRLEVAVAMAQREKAILAVMFMDLDRFKAVNDTLGHDAGDALLKEVADRLRICLRRSDTVARLGGDEFTILLPKIAQADDAALVARKINEALNVPWVWGDQQVRISGSLGIAIFPRDASEPDELLKNADTAQYQIKAHGKNGFQFFEPQMIKSARVEEDRAAPLELLPAGTAAGERMD